MTTQFERVLGRTLWTGVALSTALLSVGLVVHMASPGRAATLLLDAGLLVLMGTPMMRVALSCVEFLRERDWFFVVSAFGVLVVLGITVWTAATR